MRERSRHVDVVRRLLGSNPVVALLGPRQVGKTTLAALVAKAWGDRVTRFDLERPQDLAALRDPMLALEGLKGLVILDEVQRVPELFPVLRVLADRRPRRARFLVLGSASPELLRQTSESLAGRIAHHELTGFAFDEVGAETQSDLWLRGGFPRAYLARSLTESMRWREDFLKTFLERDLPQLGIRVPAATLRRFWMMLAHYHGQVWNASVFGRALGANDKTARNYLDILAQTFMVRVLPPWHENLGKRQVKSPKTYVADSGLLHALLGIRARTDLLGHPKAGASWEGFLLHQVTERLGARREECYFWATHSGPELDLLVVRGNKRIGFEFKLTTAPAATRSARAALDLLRLDRLYVVYAGDRTFPLADKIDALSAGRLLEDLAVLR